MRDLYWTTCPARLKPTENPFIDRKAGGRFRKSDKCLVVRILMIFIFYTRETVMFQNPHSLTNVRRCNYIFGARNISSCDALNYVVFLYCMYCVIFSLYCMYCVIFCDMN